MACGTALRRRTAIFTAAQRSDTLAAALWGIDYMHWWAQHGAGGVNFHTGDQVAAADESTPCIYAVFLSAGRGYAIQPLGYAMKAFELGGRGRVVPVRLEGDGVNLRAYGVLGADRNLYVTVINKEAGGRDAVVTLVPGEGYEAAEVVRLEVPGGDLSAKTGLRLGGAAIGENGSWRGVWSRVNRESLALPAGTAAIVRFVAGSR